MRTLERLIGMKLLDADVSENSAVFEFSDCVVGAFNPVSLSSKLSDMVGLDVWSVALESNRKLDLRLCDRDGPVISISLLAKDYSGPEAFCATFSDKTIVVE